MKQLAKKMILAFTAFCLICISAASAFAQDNFTPLPQSAYEYHAPKAPALFSGALPSILFTIAFTSFLYAVYYYWQKGKILDDMN